MSFWRYELLEFFVAFATFPVAVVAFFSWGWPSGQFTGPAGFTPFLVPAVSFLIAWGFLTHLITTGFEQHWISRHETGSTTARPWMMCSEIPIADRDEIK